MEKTILVLTMSDKHNVPEEGGYCVTGLDISNGNQWIRLLGNHASFKITNEEALYADGTLCKPLDVIKVVVEKMTPRYKSVIGRYDYGDNMFKIQPENYVALSKFAFVKTMDIQEILKMGAVSTPSYVFGSNLTSLSIPEAITNNHSIVMVKVDDFVMCPRQKYGESGYHAHYRARFTYNGINYSNISVTDPEYNPEYTDYCVLALGSPYVVISLGERFNDNHYKLIAKVFNVVYTIEKNRLNIFHAFEDCKYISAYADSIKLELYKDMVDTGKHICSECSERLKRIHTANTVMFRKN